MQCLSRLEVGGAGHSAVRSVASMVRCSMEDSNLDLVFHVRGSVGTKDKRERAGAKSRNVM